MNNLKGLYQLSYQSSYLEIFSHLQLLLNQGICGKEISLCHTCKILLTDENGCSIYIANLVWQWSELLNEQVKFPISNFCLLFLVLSYRSSSPNHAYLFHKRIAQNLHWTTFTNCIFFLTKWMKVMDIE